MCGRFTLTIDAKTFEEAMDETYGLKIDATSHALPRYNIAPGEQVLALIHDGKTYRLGELKWGMPMKGSGKPLINARAESVHEKPMFKEAFKRRRCLILADGYYEWKKTAGNKLPMRILPKSRRLFAMAGVYAPFENEDGTHHYSCAIVTTAANRDVSMIHHRMPLILSRSDEMDWVHPENIDRQSLLRSLLVPPAKESLTHYPVGSIVNNPANDTVDCIQEVSQKPHTLFDTD